MSGYSNEVFAQNLRMFRAKIDLTQEELAAKSGVSVASIHNYEDSKTAPSLINAYALAAALGCTPNDLCSFPTTEEER
ncbi:MAG: helix-turn-helix transcriptional regulator [Coriobacteriaceae bacterium]|nr:helix-turn-helix transcriptional regulator [Coriobacteriaceae bacterium]